jgi:outer membrane protein OmpA-like peptidoglycan-associated protein
MIKDAVVRIQQLRNTAEGKFLHDKTLSADEVHFEFERSKLYETAREALDAFALILKRRKKLLN